MFKQITLSRESPTWDHLVQTEKIHTIASTQRRTLDIQQHVLLTNLSAIRIDIVNRVSSKEQFGRLDRDDENMNVFKR
jgi:hypothetical protein